MIKVNGHAITPTIFPDKTSQVWKIPESIFSSKKYIIEFDFENEAEIIHLCQLVDLLKYGQVPRPISLYMPYLPYGRQDKEISNISTFALHSFAKIINNLYFDKVTTIDAHSNVGSDLFRNFESLNPIKTIESVMSITKADALAYPDKGAHQRYKHLFPNYNTIIANKERDQLTGNIISYEIFGTCKDKNILIIDDLIDGGMTFKLLSESLLRNGASCVNMYATHGIFSKGVETLKQSGINRIFTHKGEIFSSKNTNYLIKLFE